MPQIVLVGMPKVSENLRHGQEDGMGIGVGIFLIALGAILAFAVDFTVGALDLKVVGWILMAVGVGGLILFFYFWNRRRTPEAVAVIRQRQVTDQRRTYDDPTAPLPQAATVTPQPAPVTTVTATAPVVASARSGREGG